MTDFAELDIIARSDSIKQAQTDLDQLAGRGERVQQRVTRSTTLMSEGFRAFRRQIGLALVTLAGGLTIGRSVADARSLSAALGETSTLIEGTAQQMEFLERTARSMSREFGGSSTQQVEAFYQAISAGAGTVEQAAKLLDSANKLAIGGVTTTVTAVDALTTATNAYAATGLTAAEASDAMFVAIRAGKTNAEQLGGALGQVVPIASALGVSFDEVLAATAALTTQGQSTSMAITGLRSVMASVLKPSDQAAKAAKRMGLQFDTAALRSKGLKGFMDDVIRATGGNEQAMAELFPRVEALNAVLAFAGGAGDAFADTLEDMANKAGATEDAFSKVAATLDQRLSVQLTLIADAALTVGQAILNVAVPALEAATGLAGALAESVELLGVVVIGLAATQLPALVVSLYAKASAMGVATMATTAFNAALAITKGLLMFLGGPVGAFVGLLAAGTAAAYLLRDGTTQQEQAAINAAKAQADLNAALGVFAITGAPAAIQQAIIAASALHDEALAAYEAARAHRTLARDRALSGAAMPGQNLPPGDLAALQATLDANLVEPAEAAFAEAQDRLMKAREQLDATVRMITGEAPAVRLGGSAAGTFETITVTVDGLAGIGGGDDGFKGRLDALVGSLAAEREVLDQWYLDGLEILADQRAEEILGEQEHRQILLALEAEYQDQLAALKTKAHHQTLSETADFFGALASITQQGGDKLNKVTRVLGATQALINTFVAQSQVLADPSLGFFGKLAAYATIGAAGLGVVSAIRGGGGGAASPGTPGGGSSPSTTTPQDGSLNRVEQDIRVTLLRSGQGRFVDDLIADATEQIFEAVMSENRNRNFVLRVEREQ